MAIRPEQRQAILDICRNELYQAFDRVEEQLRQIERPPATRTEDEFQTVRRLYEELADKSWAGVDEECLQSLPEDLGCESIKEMIRDAFRHSPVIPIPSFAYLVSLSKRLHTEPPRDWSPRNPDAVSAVEREHLANLLEERLQEAAETIVRKLGLNEANAAIVQDELDLAQSQIIGRFTPLV